MPSQSDLSFCFEPLASRTPFEVVSFTLEETLSTPFKLTLELICYRVDVDFAELIDKPALFTICRDQQPVRYVHGLISSLSQGESGFYRTRYQAVIEPQLARARLRSNWRIFQQQPAAQILAVMFKRQGLTQIEFSTTCEHQVREFCVQAGETDLDFIARLAAEEGYIYSFDHSATAHTLRVTDRVMSLGQINRSVIKPADDLRSNADHDTADPLSVLYHSNSGGDPAGPCLRRLRYCEQVATTHQQQRDYTFLRPAYRQQHGVVASQWKLPCNKYERFDYPGRYNLDVVGKPFTQTRLTARRHAVRLAEVEGDDVRLQPGLSFNLIDHPREDLNAHWRVISVRHVGSQFTSLQEEAADADQGTHYVQHAELVPGRIDWKPALLARPRIDGPHMATVVGPPEEEIYCDQWGRVKVSFPWDRESNDNQFSSCWIRVAQGWAGGSWGSMAIPRIGQEVIVQYVNSDPDQPLITGRTYCANQLPPYELPQHKTRMTIKSQTHKGQGFNELRFEDELDRQEVFIHAQKDQNNVVRHNETTKVGNDRAEQVERDETLNVGHDRTESIGNDEKVSIGQDRQHQTGRDDVLEIGRHHSITIAQDRIEQVGNHRRDTTTANHTVDIGGHLEQKVAGHVDLKAGQAIRYQTQDFEIEVAGSFSIKSPGGTLRLDASGITLDGVAINFKGPIGQAPEGSSYAFSISGKPEPGEPVCLSCLLKAIQEGRSVVRLEGVNA